MQASATTSHSCKSSATPPPKCRCSRRRRPPAASPAPSPELLRLPPDGGGVRAPGERLAMTSGQRSWRAPCDHLASFGRHLGLRRAPACNLLAAVNSWRALRKLLSPTSSSQSTIDAMNDARTRLPFLFLFKDLYIIFLRQATKHYLCSACFSQPGLTNTTKYLRSA
jgi:hypothetical protein